MEIDVTLLAEHDQESILPSLQSHKDLRSETQQRLRNVLDGLEFKIDTFADGIHAVDKLHESLRGLADRVLEQAAGALEKREQEALERAGMQKVGIGDVLRSFSRIGEAKGRS